VRSVAIIALCVAALCRCILGPAAFASSFATATEPSPARAPLRTGLYTDTEIRNLAKFDIDKEAGPDRSILEIPCLDVVPNGETLPRGKVFKSLGIEDRRVRGFRSGAQNAVEFLTWQVSPSYDIVCMTATNDPDNKGLALTDPKRKVYGIRLVKRPP
jgi:hypothetical protein